MSLRYNTTIPIQIRTLRIKDKGKLIGRVLVETMPGGKTPSYIARSIQSGPTIDGLRTILNYQLVGTTRYFDAAGFLGRTVGLSTTTIGAKLARLTP